MWGAIAETKYDLRGRLFGIPFRVNPWFWLIAAGLGANAGSLEGIAIWVACVFVSVLVHEYGHALTARRFGGRDLHIVLYSLGGLAFSSAFGTRWQRIVQILMGPGAGFLLYGFVLSLSKLLPVDAPSAVMLQTFHFLLWINLWWGVFNLLPILPLDGGQIASQVLSGRNPEAGHRQALYASMATIVLLALGSIAARFAPELLEPLPPALRFRSDLALFLFLGFLFIGNVFELRMLRAGYGGYGGDEGNREPWEQPDDWWKK